MISGFRTCPRATKPILFIFGDPRIPQKIKKHPVAFLENITFININMLEIHVLQFSKSPAPNNPDDPSNEILKILDLRSESIKKHDMEIW